MYKALTVNEPLALLSQIESSCVRLGKKTTHGKARKDVGGTKMIGPGGMEHASLAAAYQLAESGPRIGISTP